MEHIRFDVRALSFILLSIGCTSTTEFIDESACNQRSCWTTSNGFNEVYILTSIRFNSTSNK